MKYNVVLHELNNNIIPVIRVVRYHRPELTLKEALTLVKGPTPVVLYSTPYWAHAHTMWCELQKIIGVCAHISSDPEWIVGKDYQSKGSGDKCIKRCLAVVDGLPIFQYGTKGSSSYRLASPTLTGVECYALYEPPLTWIEGQTYRHEESFDPLYTCIAVTPWQPNNTAVLAWVGVDRKIQVSTYPVDRKAYYESK